MAGEGDCHVIAAAQENRHSEKGSFDMRSTNEWTQRNAVQKEEQHPYLFLNVRFARPVLLTDSRRIQYASPNTDGKLCKIQGWRKDNGSYYHGIGARAVEGT